MSSESTHQDQILERFTETADVFAQTVRRTRVEEGLRLAEYATAGFPHPEQLVAIDVACGPGTFTRPLAGRVGRAVGVDLTPAMVEKARAEAARDGIANVEFVRGDIYALPFLDASADIASCGYACHHMTDVRGALAEMSRVVRPGGRVVVTDIIVPEGADGEFQDRVERVRDPSHTSTQSVAKLQAILRDLGLRELRHHVHDNWHDFDVWMRNAGKPPGDPVYIEVRSLMESRLENDTSGFHPRRTDKIASGLEFMHTVLLLVAEKP